MTHLHGELRQVLAPDVLPVPRDLTLQPTLPTRVGDSFASMVSIIIFLPAWVPDFLLLQQSARDAAAPILQMRKLQLREVKNFSGVTYLVCLTPNTMILLLY